MEKINFINNQAPALSAETMNTLQTNVENAIEEVAGRIVGIGAAPIGSIITWTTAAAPRGWLVCDGSAISRTTYSDLFAVVGTTYGVGDGSTTFNLPDLKGRVPVGYGTGTDGNNKSLDFTPLGSQGGEYEHTLTVNEIPEHSHRVATLDPDSDEYYGVEVVNQKKSFNPNFYTEATGGSQPHNNLQPFIVLNYIIKATKQEANTISESLPVGTELDYDGDVADIPTGWEQVTNPDSYSTTEVKTNKTWIDGKPIYRKVYTYSQSATESWTPITFSTIGLSNVDYIWFADGTRKLDSSRYVRDYDFEQNVYIDMNDSKLHIGPTENPNAFTFVFEYTKTTD